MRREKSSPPESDLPAMLFARLSPGVALERGAEELSARFDRKALRLGKFSVAAMRRAADLGSGLELAAVGLGEAENDDEIRSLLQRLARHGLVEYRLSRAQDGPDIVVIEPQMPDYMPRAPELDEESALVLSRFAYIRRRGEDMVLESPRAGAAFRLSDARVAAMIVGLSQPQTLAQLRSEPDFPGVELLALLTDCQILFTPGPDAGVGLRAAEGDDDLVRWDFHDLLFHVRSTNGRHANPMGGLYAHAHLAPPPLAVRPSWPGPSIDLSGVGAAPASSFAAMLRRRHSTRDFDEGRPITLAELARFLDGAARIVSKQRLYDPDEEDLAYEIAARPYPSGGASYELELYLAVNNCAALPRGFYHYDADRHALVLIGASEGQFEAMLLNAQLAMGAATPPQILVTMSARFGRVSWKYSGFAYSLILKHVGVLMQTLYLMATEMEIGACAIGVGDIDLFAKMTGLEFHVEGAVGQFAIGRNGDKGSTQPDF